MPIKLIAVFALVFLMGCANDDAAQPDVSQSIDQDIAATLGPSPAESLQGSPDGARTTQPNSVESAQPHDIPGSTARITGDARQGRSFAIQNCSSCHAVSADPTALLHRSAAPDFVTIAGNQDITEFSLNVWLTNPHPTMPMLILSRQDRANVAAYILSLRKP